MQTQLLFLQGAGDGAYEEDAKLVASLRRELGAQYGIAYPAAPNDGDASYGEWKTFLEAELAKLQGPAVIVAHSVGASTLLKYLSEAKTHTSIAGIFILASPFWGGEGWHYDGYKELMLPRDLESKLPKDTQVFAYHCRDDEVVPFDHLALYAEILPHATIHSVQNGGHQFNDDLSQVAQDIAKVSEN